MRRIPLRSILSTIGLSVCFLIVIFIFNNLTTHPDEPDLPVVKCNCPTLPSSPPKIETPIAAKIETPAAPKIEASTTPKTDAVTSASTVPPFPPCQPVDKNSAVQRAIIIYYPHHQSEYFFPEVRWYI